MLLLSVLKTMALRLAGELLDAAEGKGAAIKNVKTCTVWQKLTKPSLTTVSKRIKQSLIRRILMHTVARFNIALYQSGALRVFKLPRLSIRAHQFNWCALF